MNRRRLGPATILGALLLLTSVGARADGPPLKDDEQALQQAKVGIDGPSLLKFFRARILSADKYSQIQKLIGLLSDDSFEIREVASADLLDFGPAAAPLLFQAAEGSDTETVRRAEDLLVKLNASDSSVTSAAARVLAARKPAGAAEALLNYVPYAEDESVQEAVRGALVLVAVQDNQIEPILLKALDDADPQKRSAAAVALIRGGPAKQLTTLRRFLKDPDAEVRLRCGIALAEAKEKTAIPVLIELLAKLPQNQAWQAEELLYRLAQEKAPKVYLGDTDATRKKCRDAWAAWWATSNATIDLAMLSQTPKSLGYTLMTVMDNRGMGKVLELGRDGKPRWQIANLRYPLDAKVIRNNRVLIAEYNSHRVTERDFKGKVYWTKSIQLPLTVNRFRNGHTFIASQNQILVVDGKGKQVFHHQRNRHDIMAARRLRNGDYFFITNRGLGVRLNAQGKQTKSISVGSISQFIGFEELPNGRLLIPQTNSSRVVEMDPNGKILWSARVQYPSSVTRLPNGNTLVASYRGQKVYELNKAGKTVREFKPTNRPWKVVQR